MYFPNGGGTLKGISKPGEIVWSRIYIEDGRLQHGPRPRPASSSCRAKKPSAAGKPRRPQWPIMHAVPYGVSRDQMMARHKANHIQVAYANDAAAADRTLEAKAAMAKALGMQSQFLRLADSVQSLSGWNCAVLRSSASRS